MKVLIANRGTISCRIARTLKRLGIPSVAVYSEADITSTHLDTADEAICIGPPNPSQSYLNIQAIVDACKKTHATAVHPGYGFLSENPLFAQTLEENSITFIGPTPDNIKTFGLKHHAKEIAQRAGLPILPSSPILHSVDHALIEAQKIGYPVLLKSTAGGGGIGMRICFNPDDLQSNFDTVSRLAQANFKDPGVFLEKFLPLARHVEVQIFGDGKGYVLALQERDCSIQRRNQKILEETPAPNLPEKTRLALLSCAQKLGQAVNYRSAGTVEFLLDAKTFDFYFLEVNTRLQVEHGVTEEVYGIDLVEWMIRLARGETEFLQIPLEPKGHSIQARLYAEIPHRNYQPSSGRVTHWSLPKNLRIETHIALGSEVTPHYDPLLAKLIAHSPSRSEAIESLIQGLEQTEISGLETNAKLLSTILSHEQFQAGNPTTSLLPSIPYCPNAVEVIEPGTLTTLQDWPGRIGYWHVGVPPSGPMDYASFQLANLLVGNPPSAPALEITILGPTLLFLCDAIVAITGAEIEASIPLNQTVHLPANTTLRLGKILPPGCRAYLAVRGGFLVPKFLGSSSTFVLGQFGGHAGRPLRAGDILHIPPMDSPSHFQPKSISKKQAWSKHWYLRVIYGPHGAPDFFTENDISTLFSSTFTVHYNSNSTGIRLIGPKPQWARPDGGEAGLHPSNIHDNPYAIGTIDFTGDMPILLATDGPSLGGFVCPATVIQADRWILGQLQSGDTVQFLPISPDEADLAFQQTQQAITQLAYPEVPTPHETLPIPHLLTPSSSLPSPLCLHRPAAPNQPELNVRLAGDDYLLIEYGPNILDLELRLHVHAIHLWFRNRNIPGILDLTPGIRSFQIHFNPSQLPRNHLLKLIEEADAETANLEDLEVPSRILHLPLSWDDPAIQLAIEKYMRTVNPNAPWGPSNIEFIRRINGLDSTQEVHDIIFQAQYLVLGLGDVYLGAPVAIPLDPRHRLVTTKYNPARTWTAENSVGIGGAYLCIYGMEGPGGYQLFGRTVQVWNSLRPSLQFPPHKPWLLDFFDRIHFYPVSAEELLKIRRDFPLGRFQIPIEESTFNWKQYRQFLQQNASSIEAFRRKQQAAFLEERSRWKSLPALETEEAALPATQPLTDLELEIPPNTTPIRSTLSGILWKILVQSNQPIQTNQPIAIIESMKMESPILSPSDGILLSWHITEGKPVSAGQILAILQPK